MKNRLEVYEELTRLSLQRGMTGTAAEEALGYVEQAKCRSLVDAIFGRTKPLSTLGGGKGRVEAAIRDLRGELNWYYHRIEREQIGRDGFSPDRVADLWQRARTCEEALLRVVRDTAGDPIAARFGGEGPVPVPIIQSTLDANTSLVEYFQVGERLFAALLTRNGVEVVPLTTEANLRKHLRLLQFQLSKFRLGASYTNRVGTALVEAAKSHLRDLYAEILAPLRPKLQGSHLVFAPHGPLHYLPLHALYDGNEYLIDRFTVSYTPSASIFAVCRAQTNTGRGRPLIMGVQDANAPWILREVLEVAAATRNSRLLLGADATGKALREWGPHSSQIHVATHAVFRSDNPMFSAVRLTDAYLSLYDLYGLRLPVDLLTLSGCATGLNVVAAGDEILGLARGLLYAGARTLLLTLWDVHDRSTAEFMQAFYGHLREGGSGKAAALRTAMLDLRRRYPHPFHWAPFILVGKAP